MTLLFIYPERVRVEGLKFYDQSFDILSGQSYLSGKYLKILKRKEESSCSAH